MSVFFNRTSPLLLRSIFAGLIGLPGSVFAEQWHSWAADYYREITACTIASTKHIETKEELVKVTLEIGTGTASGLLSSPLTQRDNWFALHCPAETHSVWRENSASFDVHIIAKLEPEQPYTLSCAEYHRQQQARYKRTSNKVLEKLKSMLQ